MAVCQVAVPGKRMSKRTKTLNGRTLYGRPDEPVRIPGANRIRLCTTREKMLQRVKEKSETYLRLLQFLPNVRRVKCDEVLERSLPWANSP